LPLETLVLDHTTITDRSVPHLVTLKKLKHLFIADTHISKEGLAQLKAALPECKIQIERRESKPGKGAA
jgi:hypothetical protein